jgi:LacI family transcriptional regulator
MKRTGPQAPGKSNFSDLILDTVLNITKNPDTACSGLDLQPRLVGVRGIELVIGQIYRNEYGFPAHPSTTTIPALWVDGVTLRTMHGGVSIPASAVPFSL